MKFKALNRGELIAIVAASCSASRYFWPGTRSATGTRCSTAARARNTTVHAAGMRCRSCATCCCSPRSAPLILAYIIVRGHALSWPRGELTAVIALAALTLTIFRGLIDKPGDAARRDRHRYRLVDRRCSAGC